MKYNSTSLIYENELEKAAALLLKGEIVAFPTETVYGLGACIFLQDAVKKIFTAKGRPSDNPLIAHIGELSQAEKICTDLPPLFYKLAKKFFPGPLTIVVPKAKSVPSIASAGLSTIGVRMPRHKTARALINLVGQPLVAPSANLSGRPSATEYKHVLEDFGGKIPAVLVGESSEIGIESTVVAIRAGKVEILRPGAITKEELEEFLGTAIAVAGEVDSGPVQSPGMKYRHYAPEASVFLFSSVKEAEQHCLKKEDVLRIALCNEAAFSEIPALPLSAESFYRNLRLCDERKAEEILIVCDEGVRKNLGLMNRIEKSAGL